MYDVHKKRKFSNQSDDFKLPVPVTPVRVCKGQKSHKINVADLTCVCDSGASNSMIK